jgi:hypothetical protein
MYGCPKHIVYFIPHEEIEETNVYIRGKYKFKTSKLSKEDALAFARATMLLQKKRCIHNR